MKLLRHHIVYVLTAVRHKDTAVSECTQHAGCTCNKCRSNHDALKTLRWCMADWVAD